MFGSGGFWGFGYLGNYVLIGGDEEGYFLDQYDGGAGETRIDEQALWRRQLHVDHDRKRGLLGMGTPGRDVGKAFS